MKTTLKQLHDVAVKGHNSLTWFATANVEVEHKPLWGSTTIKLRRARRDYVGGWYWIDDGSWIGDEGYRLERAWVSEKGIKEIWDHNAR